MYITCSCGKHMVPKGMLCPENDGWNDRPVGQAHRGSMGPHGLPLPEFGGKDDVDAYQSAAKTVDDKR